MEGTTSYVRTKDLEEPRPGTYTETLYPKDDIPRGVTLRSPGNPNRRSEESRKRSVKSVDVKRKRERFSRKLTFSGPQVAVEKDGESRSPK